jgi:hypothetical protein
MEDGLPRQTEESSTTSVSLLKENVEKNQNFKINTQNPKN